MDKISAVIITFNEQKNIARCLESLRGVADEIIIIDSFSSDRTRDICEGFKVNFVEQKWKGYSESKNTGNALASNDYILSLDADEALSDELRNSILKEKEAGLKGAYSFSRLSNYCGKWIRHGGWYPDVKMRLWNRNDGRWEGQIHETVVLKPGVRVKRLKGDLYHYSYYFIREHLKQVNKYSCLIAEEMFRKGRKSTLFKRVFSPFAEFIAAYFLKLGFLDGFTGFTIAVISSFSTFLKYAKLKEKYQTEKP